MLPHNNNRKKRLHKTPIRLRERNRRLRARLGEYRKVTIASVGLAIALLILFGWAVFFGQERDPVLLGQGQAGIVATDSIRIADSLEADAGVDTGEPLGAGRASYYGEELAGQPTASGEQFDPGALTAAHRTLPFGSLVRVTNVRNGRSVIVRVNDRGPFSGERVIDLSHAAAKNLGMVGAGTAGVRLELLGS